MHHCLFASAFNDGISRTHFTHSTIIIMQGFQLLDKRYEVLVFMNKQTYTHISNNIKT